METPYDLVGPEGSEGAEGQDVVPKGGQVVSSMEAMVMFSGNLSKWVMFHGYIVYNLQQPIT